MTSRHAKRFDLPPLDPRARVVTAATHISGRTYKLLLECGHSLTRRYTAVPERVICTRCPTGRVKGHGGEHFGAGR